MRKTAITSAIPTTCSLLAAAPSATAVLRKTLAAQPDRSVVIAQVGFSTNLARLLDSPPDEHSPLTGRELVRAKGEAALAHGRGISDRSTATAVTWNTTSSRMSPSARALAERWPTAMVYSGFEIGIALPYPAVSIERDYGYVPHHPLAEAYIRYIPPPHNRPTWDLTSVLYAVLGDRGYFDLSPPGKVTVEADGSTRFAESRAGKPPLPDLAARAETARARGPGAALEPTAAVDRRQEEMNRTRPRSSSSASSGLRSIDLLRRASRVDRLPGRHT